MPKNQNWIEKYYFMKGPMQPHQPNPMQYFLSKWLGIARKLGEKLRAESIEAFTYSSATALMDWDRKTTMKYVNEGVDAGYFHAPKGIKSGVLSEFFLSDLSQKPSKHRSICSPEELDRLLRCPAIQWIG